MCEILQVMSWKLRASFLKNIYIFFSLSLVKQTTTFTFSKLKSQTLHVLPEHSLSRTDLVLKNKRPEDRWVCLNLIKAQMELHLTPCICSKFLHQTRDEARKIQFPSISVLTSAETRWISQDSHTKSERRTGFVRKNEELLLLLLKTGSMAGSV